MRRLSLALTDPNLVAAVVPVTAKVIPDNVTAGDYVNVTMGIQGSVARATTTGWGEAAGAGLWGGAVPGLALTPTPPLSASLPLTPTEGALAVAPPLDKIVLPQVEVIHVTRERMPNPNYGMAFGGEGASQEPAFLEKGIESVTLLVPRAAEELLYFAVDNGTLHVSIVPHAAVVEGAWPSTGVLWEDVVRFFREERLAALGVITTPVSAGGTVTAMTAAPPPSPGPTPVETASLPTAPVPSAGGAAVEPERGEDGGSGEASSPPRPLGGLWGYVVPLCIGVAVVAALGGIVLVLKRRRRE